MAHKNGIIDLLALAYVGGLTADDLSHQCPPVASIAEAALPFPRAL